MDGRCSGIGHVGTNVENAIAPLSSCCILAARQPSPQVRHGDDRSAEIGLSIPRPYEESHSTRQKFAEFSGWKQVSYAVNLEPLGELTKGN